MLPNWFIACPVALDLRPRLTPAPGGLRLLHTSDLHLTLFFLGSCSPQNARLGFAAAVAVANRLAWHPLQVGLSTVVPMGRPRAYSALSSLLSTAQAEVTAWLEAVAAPVASASAVKADAREPKPHVTLARPVRSASAEQRAAGLAWAAAQHLEGVTLRLDAIALYTWSPARGGVKQESVSPEIEPGRQFQIVERFVLPEHA